MSELIKFKPEEIQLQIADNEGMIDRRVVTTQLGFQKINMQHGLDYEVVQLDTAEWEGMIDLKK